MLTESDATVVERDRALPGLRTLLDSEQFLEALRPHLPELELRSARRTYLRYKPGMNCLAAYKLDGGSQTLRVYGKAYGSDAPVKLAKGRIRSSARGPLAGHIVLEDRAMTVSVFPDDSKLEALSRLVGPDGPRRLLETVFSEAHDVSRSEVQTIQYKPERRYVARVVDDSEPWAALKLYTPSGYREARRPALAFLPTELLRVPELLGKSDRLGAVATGWMPGGNLAEALRESDFEARQLTAVGAALAELHAQDPKGLFHRRPDSQIAAIRSLAELAGFLVPELAARADALARSLSSLLEKTSVSWASVHGDFYAKQVLLDGAHVCFLDLDAGARSEAGLDLGLFVAHLERDALRGMLTPERVHPLTEAFLEGYVLGSGRRPPVELYTSLGLFQLLHHPFRHCEPNWIARTGAILTRAEEVLLKATSVDRPRSVRRPSRVPVTDPFGVASDPKMPYLHEALDPDEIRSRLEAFVLPDRAFRLCAVRVTRHKPGRRCVIEYDLEIDGPRDGPEAVTVVGKARARGLDHRAYEASRALYQAGLGPTSSSGVSVPEPFGAIPPWNLWLQRKVSGVSATELLETREGVELARQIAAAIHQLHEAKVPSSRRHRMSDELHILHERLPRVVEQVPGWRKRIERLLDACDRVAAKMPDPRPVGIHRDFYADHVIVEPDRLHIIDLDLYCEGDPALDVGNFSGHLIEHGLRFFDDPQKLHKQRTALEERFFELSGEERRPAVGVYRLLTIVRHIHISTQLPKRRPFTERLLELSERLLFEGVSP